MKKFVPRLKKGIVYSVIFFVIISCIYLAISVFLQINTNKVEKVALIENEERLVNVEKYILSKTINELKSDLLFITDSYNIQENESEKLGKEWIAFADRKMIYDQIRFIDLNGDETIRINYDLNGSTAVEEGDLQNKKDRTYFTETLPLQKNQVYISRLDLNVENGQIEESIKPMIRLSTPVFNDKNERQGIIVLNYYAQYLLDDFRNLASTAEGDIFLLDSNSYWIVNKTDKNKEWAFMYEDKQALSFKNQYAAEWQVMNESERGRIKTENGYFVYSNIILMNNDAPNTIRNPLVLGEGNWFVVSFLSKNNEDTGALFISWGQTICNTLENEALVFFVIFLTSIIFGIVMGINKIEKERIKYFSEYDTMTGVYNRRAGYEFLQKSYQEPINKKGMISICYIDINGLKEVNDHLGHEAGDELILSIIKGIKKFIRETDYVIRLGGDEFLIVFLDINEVQAEDIWQRIKGEYNKINETEKRQYNLSVSHGIAGFKFDSNEYIDNIINVADEKMYNEKRIIKEGLEILKKTK